MKKQLYFLLVALFATMSLVLASCNDKRAGESQHESDSFDSYDALAQGDTGKPENTSRGWEYFKTEDDLTNEPTSFNAMLVSTNSQPSTYGGETKLVMTVSYKVFIKKTVNSVSFHFDNNNCRFAHIKGGGFLSTFDGGPVLEDWSYLEDGAGDKALIIIPNIYEEDTSANNFIKELKSSRTCKIQVNIENVGMKTFEFDCGGLQWDF